MPTITACMLALARILMSSLFIWDAILQLRNPSAAIRYFASVHVPAPDVSIWICVAIQIVGGLAILAGFKTRWAAAVLALFCLGTALGVHLPAGNLANMVNFYKNLVMAGGFLYVISFGAGAIAVDQDRLAA